MKLYDLPIASKVREAASGYVFLVGEHGHAGYAGTTLVCDNCVRAACVDAKEPDNPDAAERDYGNSRYSLSNIHSWLNSREKDWYKPLHAFDAPPRTENVSNGDTHYFHLPFYCEDAKYDGDYSYFSAPGFLTEFSEAFVQRLAENEVPGSYITAPEQVAHESFKARMFLLSFAEAGFDAPAFGDEGTKIRLFDDPRMRYVSPVAKAIAKGEEHVYIDACWWYWLRTPLIYEKAYSMRLTPGHRGGSENICMFSHSSSCNAEGIRPVCSIDDTVDVSAPDEKGVRTLLL